ncbi:MAG: hypothetical protein ROZ64_00175 [Burkholderiaceae bacterium]|jgi:hypothetical protein|nr:hypothetical protein [Burkholderiaceae bacterium]
MKVTILKMTHSECDLREGWADDTRHVAEEGDDSLVWLEFGDEGDADFER